MSSVRCLLILQSQTLDEYHRRTQVQGNSPSKPNPRSVSSRSEMTTRTGEANWKDHLVKEARLATARRPDVPLPTLDIIQRRPSMANRGESCNEEPPAGSRTNPQFLGWHLSDEETAEDSGSRQVGLETTYGEETVEGYTLMAGSTNFQLSGSLPPSGSFQCPGVCENDLPREIYSNLSDTNSCYKFSAEKAGEDKASAVTLVQNSDPAATLLEDGSSAAYGTPKEKKPEASHISGSLGWKMSEQALSAEENTFSESSEEEAYRHPREAYGWYEGMEEDDDAELEEIYEWGAIEGDDSSEEFDDSSEKMGYSDDDSGRDDSCDEDDMQVEDTARHWACINLSSLSKEKSEKFFDRLMFMCDAIGMELMTPINMAHAPSNVPADIEKALHNVHDEMLEFFTSLEVDEEQMRLLIVVLPDSKYSHVKVEEVCKSLGVVYQCCWSHDVMMPNKEYLKKTARQIKFKVIKHERHLRRHAIPYFVLEAPTVIFGADFLQCTPREEYIASVAASLDWPKVSKYEALVSSQPHNDGIIDYLSGGMVSKLLHAFREKTNKIAKRIIFFRNGVIEGQLDRICEQEVCAIKQACTSFEKGYQPLVTFVVVLPSFQGTSEITNKSHHILHGTVAEEYKSDPTKCEFLCCHAGEGNNSVVRYRIFCDENNLPLHELESLTKNLSSRLLDRQARPEISMVPPVHYAKVAALHASEGKREECETMMPQPLAGAGGPTTSG